MADADQREGRYLLVDQTPNALVAAWPKPLSAMESV
jgi:hypothetical protein